MNVEIDRETLAELIQSLIDCQALLDCSNRKTQVAADPYRERRQKLMDRLRYEYFHDRPMHLPLVR